MAVMLWTHGVSYIAAVLAVNSECVVELRPQDKQLSWRYGFQATRVKSHTVCNIGRIGPDVAKALVTCPYTTLASSDTSTIPSLETEQRSDG